MKRSGFTLIELLAVILVLAVIALIAVPIVSNIIDDAKKGTSKVSTYNYLSALNNYLTINELLNRQTLDDGVYFTIADSNYLDEVNELYSNVVSNVYLNDIVEIKGSKPTDGYVVIANGEVNDALLSYNSYDIECTDSITCAEPVKAKPGSVRKVVLSSNVDFASLEVGSTFSINVNTIPSNAIDKNFTYETSDDTIITVSDTGIVTVMKKGNAYITVTSQNGKQAIFRVYLKKPSEPEIIGEEASTILTLNGVELRGNITINYDDSRDDLLNYYSDNNGITWNKYSPDAIFNGVNILAKSIVVNGELESSVASKTLSVSSTSLPGNLFDGDETSFVSSSGSSKELYLDVDETMIGKKIRFLYFTTGNGNSQGVPAIWVEAIGDDLLNPLDSYKSTTMHSKGYEDFSIPSGTKKIKFTLKAGSGWGGSSNLELYEVEVKKSPNIIGKEKNYATITNEGIKEVDDLVEIMYYQTSIQKLYKIENGDWTNYIDKVSVPIGKTIYAKGIDINGKETIESYYSPTISQDGAGSILYDDDENSGISSASFSKLMLAVDESSYGMQLKFLMQANGGGSLGTPTVSVQMLDSSGTPLDSYINTSTLPKGYQSLTISEGAKYVEVNLRRGSGWGGSSDCLLYEFKVE